MAVKRFLIKKDRRDAGPTYQLNQTVFGFPMRDRWDRRLAGLLALFNSAV
jgi:hypothetical protein